jgi:hypothetical protein
MSHPSRRTLGGLLLYAVTVFLLAVVLIQAVSTNRTSQQQHDCIVQLALLLADPARDRAAAVTPPPECER